MKILLTIVALALSCSTASAGSIAPARYVDAQGVEVLHGRGTPADGPRAPVPAVRKDANAVVLDPKLVIPPAEQAARDNDRVTILQDELKEESRTYADVWSRLKVTGRRDNLGAEEIVNLNAKLVSHQKNIEALNNELRRAKQAQSNFRRVGSR